MTAPATHRRDDPEAVVVGSGPNGLAAAIELARNGVDVAVIERAERAGGGCRSEALTLPDFVHDPCSTVHALALASPFIRGLELERDGLELIQPPVPLAHPLDDGTAVLLERSPEATADGLGADGDAYLRLLEPLVAGADGLLDDLLGPLRPPRHPLLVGRFGLHGLRSAEGLARGRFAGERARALLAGLAGHSMLSLRAPGSAAFALVLSTVAHRHGWPVARGGSQRLADALVARLHGLGGTLESGRELESIDELAGANAILADVAPAGLERIAGHRLPDGYLRRLRRFRHGPGAFKLDWALDGPIPWRAPDVGRAGTVHLGGTLAEIVESERAVAAGEHPERPFVLLVQASRFDPTRVPEGKHSAWAYCHVPNRSEREMTAAIEAQVERFAPGFGELVIGRSALGPRELEARNPNYVGGDINAGVQDLRQLFARPVARAVPYSTPNPRLLICSSSTPPGGGVHGMCGYHAAHAALRGPLR